MSQYELYRRESDPSLVHNFHSCTHRDLLIFKNYRTTAESFVYTFVRDGSSLLHASVRYEKLCTIMRVQHWVLLAPPVLVALVLLPLNSSWTLDSGPFHVPGPYILHTTLPHALPGELSYLVSNSASPSTSSVVAARSDRLLGWYPKSDSHVTSL